MFTDIDHVAIVVEDVDAAMDHLETVFGLDRMGTNSKAHREEHGVIAAFYRTGGGVLEVMAPTREEGWAAEHLRAHGEGFFHVAFAVDDVRERMAELEAAGIGIVNDEPQQGFSGEIVTLEPADTIVPMQLVEPA